ncbi:MAG: hypothetical protein H7269_14160 [Cellulomonas sp.]|nr:hypothetical protein [Cellulomonas sp.]
MFRVIVLGTLGGGAAIGGIVWWVIARTPRPACTASHRGLMAAMCGVDGIGVHSSPLGLTALVPLPDLALAVARLLVQLGIGAAVLLVLVWLARVLWRERVLWLVGRQFPDQAAQMRKAARRVPLMRAPRGPADPYARTHHVVVEPVGDGRPGESFWASGPSRATGEFGSDGSRQDAAVTLSAGVHFLVVCLGRLGAVRDGIELRPAAERVELARAAYVAPHVALGPVDRVPTAAGIGWRTTSQFGTGKVLTDTHVDRDGWAFIVGVLSSSWHARAVDAYDALLTTWRWLPDAAAQAGESTSPEGS